MDEFKMRANGDLRANGKSSEKNNGAVSCRKPRPKDIISGDVSTISRTSSTVKRPVSPSASRRSSETESSQPKRAISAQRRPSTPSRSSTPLSMLSRPSTPLGLSTQSTTPINDSVLELRKASRRPSNDASYGLWPSMRSLSSSFREESWKEKNAGSESKRDRSPRHSVDLDKSRDSAVSERRSPLQGKDAFNQMENSRPSQIASAKVVDQRRWPAMMGGKLSSNAMTRSMDFSDKAMKSSSLAALSRGVSPKRMSNTERGSSMSMSVDMTDEIKRRPHSSRGTSPRRVMASASVDAISNEVEFTRIRTTAESSQGKSHGASVRNVMASNTAMSRSVDLTDRSSKLVSTSLTKRGISPKRGVISSGPDAMSKSVDLSDNTTYVQLIHSSAVLPQGVSSVRLKESEKTGKETVISLDTMGTNELSAQKVSHDHSTKSAGIKQLRRLTRTLTSPIRGLLRPSSPSNNLSALSSSKRLQSPSRARPSSPISLSRPSTSSSDGSSSFLNYMIDATKGKRSSSQGEETHQLRLLYNRILQWRFVNALADEAQTVQKIESETILYNICSCTVLLHESIVLRRLDVQKMKQVTKIGDILKKQIDYLDQWAELQAPHHTSLLGATEALRGSTLRLPVTSGTRADVESLKNAISSAVEVMQTLASSSSYLLLKFQGVNSLIGEISDVAQKEQSMLNECRELLGRAASLQVQECSLRSQLLLRRRPEVLVT